MNANMKEYHTSLYFYYISIIYTYLLYDNIINKICFIDISISILFILDSSLFYTNLIAKLKDITPIFEFDR